MNKLLKSIIPYPFISDGVLKDGFRLRQSNYCRKCVDKDCLKRNTVNSYFECKHGFSCYCLSWAGKTVVVNGVLGPSATSNFSGHRRKSYRQYKVTNEDIHSLQETLSSITVFVKDSTNERVRDSVSFLHDIRTSVAIVLSWCQELISKQGGGSFEEQLNEVDRETASLFQAISLLQEQLALTDIIANPESITYGKMHPSQIHGFILKMVRLFEPRAAKRDVSISLRGSTFAEVLAFNSFQFVPLILLDNAVKYSFRNRDIRVSIVEEEETVLVKVSSFGHLVPVSCRDKIFGKYFRGPNVIRESPHGMGMGLYIARLIAEAHATSITYTSHPEVGKVGSNEFTVSIRKAR